MSCTRSYTSSHTLFNGRQGLALRKTHVLHKHHRSYTSSHTLFNGQGLALRKTHVLHKHHRSYTSSHTLFNGRQGLALRKTHVLHKALHIKSHTYHWTTRTDFVKATHKVIMPQKSHFNSCNCLDLSKQSHLLHKDRQTNGL